MQNKILVPLEAVVMIIVIAIIAVLCAALAPANASTGRPNQWLHVGRVGRYPGQCAPRGKDDWGVVVWSRAAPHGSSALICRNGRTFTS